jgi:hypothetical protein
VEVTVHDAMGRRYGELLAAVAATSAFGVFGGHEPPEAFASYLVQTPALHPRQGNMAIRQIVTLVQLTKKAHG